MHYHIQTQDVPVAGLFTKEHLHCSILVPSPQGCSYGTIEGSVLWHTIWHTILSSATSHGCKYWEGTPSYFHRPTSRKKGIYGCKHLETDNLPKDRKVNPRYFTGILHFYLLPYPLGGYQKKLPGTRFPRYFLLKIA